MASLPTDSRHLVLFRSPVPERSAKTRISERVLYPEHPPLNLEEIANICGALFGRRPDGQTVKAVLTLHGEGWSDKGIADLTQALNGVEQ